MVTFQKLSTIDGGNERVMDSLIRWADRLLQYPQPLENAIQVAHRANPWFDPVFVRFAIDAIAQRFLNPDELDAWLSAYHGKPVDQPKTVGIVMAGNIPLVGFHDLLCVLASGHYAMIKLSSKDEILLPALLDILAEIDPQLAQRITQVERLKGFDAVIATGSNNTLRYFRQYFSGYPSILRGNRNSLAVLTGNETAGELTALGDDIFLYFGLGCRSISKLFLPEGYNPASLFDFWKKYEWLFQHHYYMNNYDYNRTILLLNGTPHYANNYVMMVENPALASRIATVHYAFYGQMDEVSRYIAENRQQIQCVAGEKGLDLPVETVPFGETQLPRLTDYPDDIDVMEFLYRL